MPFLGEVKALTVGLRFRENWISAAGGWAVSGIFGLCGAAMDTALPFNALGKILTPVICFVLGGSVWWSTRYVYWKSGSGRKIGLSFDGYKTPEDDWVEVRTELHHLFENSAINRRVTFRIFPSYMTATEPRWASAERRYGLSNLFRMVTEPSMDKDKPPRILINLRAQFEAQVSMEFGQAVEALTNSVMVYRRPVQTSKDILRFQAASVFGGLLMHLAAIEFAAHRFDDAEIFLQKLDDHLALRGTSSSESRMNVQWLHSLCLISRSHFPGDSPPAAEDLLEVTQKCEIAVEKYGCVFPSIRNIFARDLFYLCRFDDALLQTDLALASNLSELDLTNSKLNRAVLLLALERHAEAVVAFGFVFSDSYLAGFDWNDLIRFADHAEEYGIAPAIFIRVLYRRILRIDVPNQIARRFARWTESGNDRKLLQNILLAKIPDMSAQRLTPSNKSKTSSKVKVASGTSPKTGHRKRKPRSRKG